MLQDVKVVKAKIRKGKMTFVIRFTVKVQSIFHSRQEFLFELNGEARKMAFPYLLLQDYLE